ncbi:hypothetical protein [Streptomyces sp. NPDC048659]|uniref:hypothetical protein n=1 Tax=Streptomyces sp. NPDC048659 TaxID=3155489 RepID=UPI003443D958
MTTDQLPEPPRGDTPPRTADGAGHEPVPGARLSAERHSDPVPAPPSDPEEAAVLAEEAEYERLVLAEAAAVGRRAAAWMRGLPLPPGDWVREVLASAVEETMGSLGRADAEGVGARDALDGLVRYLADAAAPVLSRREQTALLAVAGCVRGIPRLLTDDPRGAIHHGELAALGSLIDYAITMPSAEGAPGRRTARIWR